jgi:hypothetical protein
MDGEAVNLGLTADAYRTMVASRARSTGASWRLWSAYHTAEALSPDPVGSITAE